MTFAAGLIAGFLIGTAIAYYLGRRSSSDATAIAEMISGKVVGKQMEQLMQVAKSELAGKKDVIDGTLKHVKDELGQKMRDMERLMQNLGKDNAKIDQRLDNAATAIKDLSDTAGGLRNALSSNSLRGQWGERMAEDVLRLSGLIEGINFTKQVKLEAGSKPDFTFILPQQKTLNMDVKFPFNNYQEYIDAKTDTEKEEYKAMFLKDVRKRLKEVQTRDYINPADGTVDYVLLFVPNEQIFAFINEFDRSLIDEAMRGKTILCSPLSLYAILGIIRQSMDNFAMESKSQEMLTIFGAFKMQWEKFKDQMESVKERFESVHKGYEELTGTRERMLDKQLNKIEEIRSGKAPSLLDGEEMPAQIKEKVTRKLIATQG